VIWVGTSNIGQDIILSYHEARERKTEMMTREEYVELMGIVRPRLSDQLGASVLSRVSAILPFVPFTDQERRAIASEFISQSEKESELVKEMVLSKEKSDENRWREQIIKGAMSDFILSEGARSLYRAVSSQLVDSLDDL
jgi:ATP-dependent Clp protease ATP-binding subunit ClpA